MLFHRQRHPRPFLSPQPLQRFLLADAALAQGGTGGQQLLRFRRQGRLRQLLIQDGAFLLLRPPLFQLLELALVLFALLDGLFDFLRRQLHGWSCLVRLGLLFAAGRGCQQNGILVVAVFRHHFRRQNAFRRAGGRIGGTAVVGGSHFFWLFAAQELAQAKQLDLVVVVLIPNQAPLRNGTIILGVLGGIALGAAHCAFVPV